MVKDHSPGVGSYPVAVRVPDPRRLRKVLLWLATLSVAKANVYVTPLAVKVHNGLAEPPGHVNPFQATTDPKVPAKAPVGPPVTATPVKLVAAVAAANDKLLTVAVPLMSIAPVIGTA
jgi:hypothetical protein